MKIVNFPNKALMTKSSDVVEFNEELKKITEDMTSLMYEKQGIGLAANQVAILQNIIIMDCKNLPNRESLYVFVNPKIIFESNALTSYKEGCLSFPSLFVDINRPNEVKVQWQTITGETKEQTFTGLEATCIQHEIDHINGIVFVDRLSKTKRQMSLTKYSKSVK